MKYGFIGCGNMGGAVAKALRKATDQIMITDRSGKAKKIAEELGCDYADAQQIIENSDCVFLAVKPQVMESVLESLKPALAKKKPLVVSMAACIVFRKSDT